MLTMEATMTERTRWSELPVVMTADEVADVLRISYKTVLRLRERGELPGRKVGREWRFNRRDVMEYMGLDPEAALEEEV